ncbi:hypothetical protein [Sphingomonas tagetis]|nr:hypothetical protein [Sphingomonas tagetis]
MIAIRMTAPVTGFAAPHQTGMACAAEKKKWCARQRSEIVADFSSAGLPSATSASARTRLFCAISSAVRSWQHPALGRTGALALGADDLGCRRESHQITDIGGFATVLEPAVEAHLAAEQRLASD